MQPQGKLKPVNNKEPYSKSYAIIVRYGKRRIYTDDNGQRWVKCNGKYWRFPEEVEL
jgi:hypothetical protein